MSRPNPNTALAPALRPLRRRVRLRWFLERARRGLLWGLPPASLGLVAAKVLARDDLLAPLLLLLAAGVAVYVAAGLRRLPGTWAAAAAADGLGLAEQVTSALHAERTAHRAAPLLVERAARAMAGLEPSDYHLVPRPRRWRVVGLASVLLVVAMVAPIPVLGDAARQVEEDRAVASARTSVEALQSGLQTTTAPEPIELAARQQLAELDEALARAATAEEVAQALEQAQEQLASLPKAEDYAWRRATESLAGAWNERAQLADLARALVEADPQAVEEALAELSSQLAEMTPSEQRDLQLALQSGANAARDVPELSGALREAASRLSAEAANGSEGQAGENGGDPLDDVAPLLAQGAARSAGLQAAQQALTGLAQTQAQLSQAAGVASAGQPTGSAQAGSASGGQSGGNQGSSQGSGSDASGNSGSGQGSGTGTGNGEGSGNGQGSSSGGGSAGSGGNSAGNSSGQGSAGSGAGAGAGVGGGPTPGQPSEGNAGQTTSGGSNIAPSNSGATNYDPIYAPSLLGGEGGPRVQAPGQAEGNSGQTVDLPNSPLSLGSVRPYNEVYGEYEAAARQSLSRQPLPPALQSLVQKYFSALKPATTGGEPAGGGE
ncbi:MAG: hypothetical protein ACYC1C_13060 [Chloroflexota bacterium]